MFQYQGYSIIVDVVDDVKPSIAIVLVEMYYDDSK